MATKKETKPKATTTKKVKEVVEVPKVETIETLVGDMEVLSSESPEVKPVIGDEPPSVTLEEVKEVEKVEEDVVQTEEVLIPVIEKSIEQIKEARAATNEEISIEQKITNYLNDKEGELRINDFLKSLFGLPKFNEPAQWLLQGNSKYLRSVLEGMQTKGDITIKDNRHRMLGQSHYEPITGKQLHHTLNTVDIVVKK